MSRWTSDCVSSVPGYRSSGLLWSFFSDDTATAEFCTLSLHDALPILVREAILRELDRGGQVYYVHNRVQSIEIVHRDRKSTRLNSSHSSISYAVFCLKKNNKHHKNT